MTSVTSVTSAPRPWRRIVATLGRLAVQLLVPVGLVVLWWRTSADSGSYLYPPLTEVLAALRDEWLTRFDSDLRPSLGRFAAGYLLAAVLGITLGTLLGLVPPLRRATQPLVELVRSIPPTLLFPLALATFGVGDDARVALIALGSMWPVLLNTVDGVRGVDPLVLDVARSFRIDRWRRVTQVSIPAAAPKIVAGLRVALSVALLLMVVGEMRGGTDGIGFQIRSAERRFDTTDAYAGVLVIGAVGLVANLLFVVVERRVMGWHRGLRGLAEAGDARGRLA